MLRSERTCIRWTEKDHITYRTIDDWLLSEPFAEVGEDDPRPWAETLSEVQMQAVAKREFAQNDDSRDHSGSCQNVHHLCRTDHY